MSYGDCLVIKTTTENVAHYFHWSGILRILNRATLVLSNCEEDGFRLDYGTWNVSMKQFYFMHAWD